MSILLADAGHWTHLLPLTFTRPVGALRPGIVPFNDTWHRRTGLPVGFSTEGYLRAKFPGVKAESVFEVDGSLLPTKQLVDAVMDLELGEVLVHQGRPLAFHRSGLEPLADTEWAMISAYWKPRPVIGELISYTRPWHLFQHCAQAITNDLDLITSGRTSAPLSNSNTVIGDPKQIFLEEGAVVEASTLNTKSGPIYIGKGAEVMEGCLLRGPIVLGDHAQIKMGAKIYGPSAFGPECRVGGEVNNSVILGYSNKGHDGFLGNSVLGEWCNLGADTNNSNLKNTYGEVSVYGYAEDGAVPTGLQFCGLIMGDHSKSGINTMFNTGTVVGVCANIFGGDFPPKQIPGFSWGGVNGFDAYELDKALVICRRVMERRHVPFTALEDAILREVCRREEEQAG